MANRTNEIKGLFVNYLNGTIEVTESFLAKAGKLGTAEQRAMIKIRKEIPEYKIVVIKPEKKKESYEKLTIERMIAYVTLNGKDTVEKFSKDVLVYVDEESQKLQKGKYATVKRIFLATYGKEYTEMCHVENDENKLYKITRLDEMEKEIKSESKGKIGKFLKSKNKAEIINMPLSEENTKVVNE